jgi:S-phase kinase-associated protein 1
MTEITLLSCDGTAFVVDIEVAKMSATIKTMIEFFSDLRGYYDDEPVPLPNVKDETLKLFIEWAEYHKNDPPAPEDDETKEKRTDDISSWDKDFLKKPLSTLLDLFLTADFLDVKGLQDLTCNKVLRMMKSKTLDEKFHGRFENFLKPSNCFVKDFVEFVQLLKQEINKKF